MSLTQCQTDTNIIENLPDSPTLDTQELKRKFDEGSSGIKDFINTTLLEQIETLVATEKRNLQTIIANEKKNLLANITEQILEDNKKKYYVGKIIIDTKNVNPATYLGFGTWQLWGAGRVPVGINSADSDFNTVEKTGGNKTHKHNNGTTGGPNTNTTGSTALTINQIPNHAHKTPNMPSGYAANKAWGNEPTPYGSLIAGTENISTETTGGGQGHTHTLSSHTHTIGDGTTLQPYITCYMWKRVG